MWVVASNHLKAWREKKADLSWAKRHSPGHRLQDSSATPTLPGSSGGPSFGLNYNSFVNLQPVQPPASDFALAKGVCAHIHTIFLENCDKYSILYADKQNWDTAKVFMPFSNQHHNREGTRRWDLRSMVWCRCELCSFFALCLDSSPNLRNNCPGDKNSANP